MSLPQEAVCFPLRSDAGKIKESKVCLLAKIHLWINCITKLPATSHFQRPYHGVAVREVICKIQHWIGSLAITVLLETNTVYNATEYTHLMIFLIYWNPDVNYFLPVSLFACLGVSFWEIILNLFVGTYISHLLFPGEKKKKNTLITRSHLSPKGSKGTI